MKNLNYELSEKILKMVKNGDERVYNFFEDIDLINETIEYGKRHGFYEEVEVLEEVKSYK